jgi:hypothetical protein
MSIKLTDTQLVLLGAAAQRKDLCLVAPPTLKGATAQKVASKLISAGFVKEVKAKASDSIWRRNEESGASYGLKLTAAGAKAIAVDDAAEPEVAGEDGDARGGVENFSQRRLEVPADRVDAALSAEIFVDSDRGRSLGEIFRRRQGSRDVAFSGWVEYLSSKSLALRTFIVLAPFCQAPTRRDRSTFVCRRHYTARAWPTIPAASRSSALEPDCRCSMTRPSHRVPRKLRT